MPNVLPRDSGQALARVYRLAQTVAMQNKIWYRSFQPFMQVALPQPLPLLPHHISPSFDPLFESEHADMGLPSNFIF